MRLLLDECLPRRLKAGLPGHECTTVPERGWGGIKNGALLALAATEFAVFLTVDRRLVRDLVPPPPLALILLVAPSTDIDDLRPLLPAVLTCLESIRPGEVVRVAV